MRRCAARWCRCGSLRWPWEALVEGELGLAGPLALLLGVARGLDVPELERGLVEPELGVPGSLLRSRDFLAAPFLLGWRLMERVSPRGRAPWSHGVFLERRRLVRPRSFIAHAGRSAAQ